MTPRLFVLLFGVFLASLGAAQDAPNITVPQMESSVPQDLLPFAGTSLQRTNLRLAVFRNGSRGVENAAEETFGNIARRRRIRYDDMLKFINETQIKIRERLAKDQQTNETLILPAQVIHRAAAIQMLEIGGAGTFKHVFEL